MLSLKEIFENFKIDEQKSLNRITDKNIKLVQHISDIRFLWGYNQIFGLYHLFIGNNLQLAKQDFYTCGRIDEYLIKKYDSRLLDAGMANVCYALLSDDSGLIKRYTELGHSKYRWMVEHGHSTIVYAFQQAIKGDWEQVKWSLEIMNTKNQKLNKGLLPDRMFLEGLCAKNQKKMEEALLLLLKDHKKRNKHMGIAQDYISIPTLGYAKLAWLKGIEVEVDHPLIPKESLPYRPLPKYEDKYDFLK